MSILTATWPTFFTRPLSQPGVARRFVERLFQQALAFGWALPSVVPEEWKDAAGVAEAVLNVNRTTHKQFVLTPDGQARPLFYDAEETRPVIGRDQNSFVHPVDNWVDRAQAAFKARERVRAARLAAAEPDPDNVHRRIVSPDGLTLDRWIDAMPAPVGVIVNAVSQGLGSRTRELPGFANMLAELAVGIDTVLGSWKELRRTGKLTFKEWESLRDAGHAVENKLKNGGLMAWKHFWKTVSGNVPAVTALYRLRRMNGLNPTDRLATVASAAMICVAAFEEKPRELYWLRMWGEALRAVTVERRTLHKWTRPLGEARGLIRLAQAFHPIILPLVKKPALKKLATALLVTDLRVYLSQDVADRPIKKLHQALRDVKDGPVPANLRWAFNTLSPEEEEALRKHGTIPEHLDILWRVSDQPIHDGLIGEGNVLGKLACKYPDVWQMLKNTFTNVLGAVGVPDELKAAGLDLYCTGLKALGGAKNIAGEGFEGFDANENFDIDRFEMSEGGVAKDVQGKWLMAGARPQPIGAYVTWALVDRFLSHHIGLIKAKPLPPEHRPPTADERATQFHSQLFAARHPIISSQIAFRNSDRPENWWRLFMHCLGAVLPEDARNICNTIADIPYQWNVGRPGLT